jgi:hypothetical protein
MKPCGFCLTDEELLAEKVHDGVAEGLLDVEDAVGAPVGGELELRPVFAEESAPGLC